MLLAAAVVVAGIALAALMLSHASRSSPEPFAGVRPQDGVIYATSRRWPADQDVADSQIRWLSQHPDGILLNRAPPMEATPCICDITLLVHGYSAGEQSLVQYFSGLVDYLRADAGYDDVIVVFDWPSTGRHYDTEAHAYMTSTGVRNPALSWEVSQYSIDKIAAAASAAVFVNLLDDIRANWRPRRINVIAHSMGAFVVTEAMRHSPRAFREFGAVVLLAPDVDSRALIDSKAAAALGVIDRLSVYYSRRDLPLGYSRVVNFSPRLGLEGLPGNATLPSNVAVHDVTTLLGQIDVHGRYLTRDGARLLALADDLR